MSTDYPELVDSLDHIWRVARSSRTKSRRDRWIAERARCALEGGEDWKGIDLPKTADDDIKRLRRRIAALEQERDEPKARVRELLNGISHTSTELVCKRAVETGEKQFLGLYVHPELGEVPIYVEAQMPLRETGA